MAHGLTQYPKPPYSPAANGTDMEIDYQLHASDLDLLRQHLLTNLRRQRGGMFRRWVIWVFIGFVAASHAYRQEYWNAYHYLIWLLPLALYIAALIWLPIWQHSQHGQRWLAQYAGRYVLDPTPAGISFRAPNGRIGFHAWPEITGFEAADAHLYLYLYLRRDIAIPIPCLALGNAADVDDFSQQIRNHWSAHPENLGKTLPAIPPAPDVLQVTAIANNLLQAARLAFFLPYDHRSFRVSFGMFLQLLLLNLLCIGLVDYIDAMPAPEFNVYGVNKFAVTTLLLLGGTAFISNLTLQRETMPRLLVMVSAAELVIHAVYFSGWLAAEHWWPDFPQRLFGLFAAAMVWSLAVVFRILRRLYPQPAPSILLLLSIYAFFTLSLNGLSPSHRLYYNAETDGDAAENQADNGLNEEDLYYRQAELVDEELAALQNHRPGKTDLYFVGFAGQAEERVFFNDVSLARNVLDSRFNTAGRSVALLNNTDTAHSAPLANRHNLQSILRGVAQRMDKDQDVLFLYLSSHGAQDHSLSVSFWPLNLNDLKAEELKDMLDEAGILNRVIVVSACYSGGFLDVLKDDNSLILTASSRDHESYGCGDFTQYTYFGESYFARALANGDSFIGAFDEARRLIAAREREEGLDASGPQSHVGQNIAGILRNLEVTPANIDDPTGKMALAAGLTFEQRVRQSRRFEQDATAQDYTQKNVLPAMSTALSESLTDCLAQPGASTAKFTLLADIQQDGEVDNVDYRPATNTAECFGKAFSALRLPPLPNELSALPVFFDMMLSD